MTWVEADPIWRPEESGCSRTPPAPGLDELDGGFEPDPDSDAPYGDRGFGFDPRR